jgi:D-aminopeptidase
VVIGLLPFAFGLAEQRDVRLRDLGVVIGTMPTGPHNAITDVPGVLVGHSTLIADTPSAARTGVTVVMPHAAVWREHVFAAVHSFNGFGELTGAHWLEEAGVLSTPIAITNTYSVGTAYEALMAVAHERGYGESAIPVVAETWDGWLNDLGAFHVRREHVVAALDTAAPGPVAEGNVGGGTGMICHGFKGGIGTASRRVDTAQGRHATGGATYTVGALVQANYGARHLLRVDGVPVGQAITPAEVPLPWGAPPTGGSIIIVLATDAPLLPVQCRRLARRATAGLARVGGYGHDSSGDIFLCFSTAARMPAGRPEPHSVAMLPNGQIDPLFDAVVEVVEEAIANALCAAETMTGLAGHVAHRLPHARLEQIMAGRR